MQSLLVVCGFSQDGVIDFFMLNTAKNSKYPFRIAILAYQTCMGTEIFAIADVPFDVQVIRFLGKSVNVAGGIAARTKQPRGVYDPLIVPGLEVGQREQRACRLNAITRKKSAAPCSVPPRHAA